MWISSSEWSRVNRTLEVLEGKVAALESIVHGSERWYSPGLADKVLALMRHLGLEMKIVDRHFKLVPAEQGK